MTPKKKNPQKRGRKAGDPEQRLEQLTIRLPAKLKFGLDLLARAQHRSLSQAVEWALLVGLNNYRVNNEWDSVAALMDRAWSESDEFDRLNKIYFAAPDLLSFEDRAGCEVVDRSTEAEMANEYLGVSNLLGTGGTAEERVERSDIAKSWQEQRQRIFFDFVRAYWPQIRERAVDRVSSGKSHEGASLETMLGFKEGLIGLDPFARMQAFTEISGREFSVEKLADRLRELDTTLPWSTRGQENLTS